MRKSNTNLVTILGMAFVCIGAVICTVFLKKKGN